MYLIGLTGGVGSGKSTLANYFKKLGVEVIDCDEIAHQLIQQGTPAYQQILGHFGPKILQPDHNINRKLLREKIFHDQQNKAWLENLLHPLIIQEIQDRASQVQSTYAIVVIPLLVEVGLQKIVDRVLVIDVPESVQISRTSARDGVDRSLVEAMIQNQATRSLRNAAADDIINNDADQPELFQQADKLHQQYLQAATQQP